MKNMENEQEKEKKKVGEGFCWVLGVECWVLMNSYRWVLGDGCWVLGVEC